MTKYYCSLCGNTIDNEIESFVCDVLDDSGEIKDYTALCPKCMERIENNEPDEYRKKYPSCRICEYFYEDDLKIKCLAKNCIPEFARAKKCKVYKPIPYKESETNE